MLDKIGLAGRPAWGWPAKPAENKSRLATRVLLVKIRYEVWWGHQLLKHNFCCRPAILVFLAGWGWEVHEKHFSLCNFNTGIKYGDILAGLSSSEWEPAALQSHHLKCHWLSPPLFGWFNVLCPWVALHYAVRTKQDSFLKHLQFSTQHQ